MRNNNVEPDFWKKHSIQYLKMAFNNDYRERLASPDGYGKNISDCGDTIEIYIMGDKDRLDAVAFDTEGCINTDACANSVVQMVKGKSVAEAWEITPEKIVGYLETLPEESTHCAELAVGALRLALTDLQRKYS
ncbi:iron-sulfur cluster assembly scaffold protein [bacterium]|nr:iron-sulfur cluster assembly scaffold protein [bacterium]